jgi:hypothetical protein
MAKDSAKFAGSVRIATSVTVLTQPAWILRSVQAVQPKRMTLPASKQNLAAHANVTSTSSNQKTSGWDPFEIWRTRVLLPRLAGMREETTAATPAKPIKLVRP